MAEMRHRRSFFPYLVVYRVSVFFVGKDELLSLEDQIVLADLCVRMR